jgi:hypothetical protein
MTHDNDANPIKNVGAERGRYIQQDAKLYEELDGSFQARIIKQLFMQFATRRVCANQTMMHS